MAILRLLLVVSLVASVGVDARGEDERSLAFNRDIRPILADKCLACHGADIKKREADLRLDDPESSYRERDDGRVIDPGKPDESLLWQRISTEDETLVMPPQHSTKQLTDRERSLLRQWIEQGAKFEKHWAFESPKPVAIPEIKDDSLVRNPIDAFLQTRLRSLGLSPAQQADKGTLIRRVAFALTGLPPTLEEQAKFMSDDSTSAYEKMVDRFLASERYGEEMARHWLDVARYADTHGMHLDNERQTWAYRDWVIQAFNRNLPFDEFTLQQLAGDLLPDAKTEHLIATGFNRCNVTSSEGGSIDAELLYRYAVDRASTTMEAWMGLTGGCAACHDHKFDPISQKEFYSFYAFFNSAADPAMDGNALLTQPVLKLELPEVQAKLAELKEKIELEKVKIESLASDLQYAEPALGEATEGEQLWFEDAFPEGKLHAAGAALQIVDGTEAKPAYRGNKLIQRTETGLGQDVWESNIAPFVVPANGHFFVWVQLDPANPPKSIMVQFHRQGWNHRAVWGDAGSIPWGTIDTDDKRHLGPLPEMGKWVQLTFPFEQVGLKAGDFLTGFALTQFGGSVQWDHVGTRGSLQEASDPLVSLAAWKGYAQGRDLADLPEELRGPAKSGTWDESQTVQLKRFYLEAICTKTRPRFRELRDQQRKLQEEFKRVEESLPGTFIYRDMEKPRPSFVMMRGSYDKPGEAVEPNVPAVFPALDKSDASRPANRLDLARWLISPQHPLTSRVTINRFWQQLFGTGIVKTSYDFGTQGEMPSHPELLDWLAQHYQNSGWDTKALIRMMVTSHAFRQSSVIRERLLEIDPENRWLARGPRFRLDAEPIRDNALFVSGLMNQKMGGKGVKTYQPPNIWEPVGFAGSNTRFYQQDSGESLYRRSVYTFYKRTAPPPFMSNFDAPNREQFCSRRERSNTPLQALQLMNDIQQVEAARALATRMIHEGGSSLETQLDFAYRLVLSRPLADREFEIWQRQYELHHQRFGQEPEAAKKLLSLGESKYDATMDPVRLATLTMLCNTLLNLDETLCRN